MEPTNSRQEWNKTTIAAEAHAKMIEKGYSKSTLYMSRAYLDTMLEVFTEALLRGEIVRLVNFGTFSFRRTPASNRPNPQDRSQIVSVPERMTPRWKPATAMKKMIAALPLWNVKRPKVEQE